LKLRETTSNNWWLQFKNGTSAHNRILEIFALIETLYLIIITNENCEEFDESDLEY
jgi:hypothetical protein